MNADALLVYHLPGMVDLLLSRKAALEAAIADRHRAARETGTAANVTALSAVLRAVKSQLRQAKGEAAR